MTLLFESLPQYPVLTTAQLPTLGSTHAGTIVTVSDAAPGPIAGLAYWTGTAWLRLSDGQPLGAAVPAASSVERGESVLSGAVGVSNSNNSTSTAATFLSVTLGTPGDYTIDYVVRGQTFSQGAIPTVCLTDQNDVLVPNSEVILSYQLSGAQLTGSGTAQVTTSATGAVYKLKGFNGNGDGNFQVLSSGDGRTKVTWHSDNKNLNSISPSLLSFYRRANSRYYSAAINQSAPTTLALTVNTLRAYPYVVTTPLTLDQLITEVSTAVASSTYRVALYADTGATYPGALIASTDAAQYSGASTGVQTGTPPGSITLSRGLYWIAVNSGVACTLRAIPTAAIAPTLGWSATLGASGNGTGYTVAQTFGAMPSTFPAGATVLNNTAAPLVAFRSI
jgi:hypothetical protein